LHAVNVYYSIILNSKIGFCSIRFVGEAAALFPSLKHQQRAL
jgi:hypothetical protein